MISASASVSRPLADSASASRSEPTPVCGASAAKYADNLLRRHALRHLPLAGAAQRLQPGPVRVADQEATVLVPGARPVAEPGPEHDVDRD